MKKPRLRSGAIVIGYTSLVALGASCAKDGAVQEHGPSVLDEAARSMLPEIDEALIRSREMKAAEPLSPKSYCPSCGVKLVPAAKSCASCGG